MSELREEIIPKFSHDSFRFAGAKMFSSDSGALSFMIASNGCTFLCDREIAEEIKNLKPSRNVITKLRNRGFEEGFEREDIRKKLPILPRFFIIDFTTQCNMNCYYCLRHFENQGNIIEKEKLIPILDYLIAYYHQYNLPEISIQPWGGEPLLALDLICFMREYLSKHQVNADISVQTNGVLLTQETLETLQKYDIGIGVSIDGCREIHDMHRKDLGEHGTFDTVAKHIKAYQDSFGNKVGTISVISKMSLPYVKKSMEVLAREVGVELFKFNFMHPNSELFDASSVVSCEDIDRFWKEVIQYLLELNEQGYLVNEYNISDKVYNLLAGGGGDICHSNGCTGGYHFVSFTQEGDIYPCEMMGVHEYKLGSIYEENTLPELLKRSIENGNPYFTAKTDAKCENCEWAYYCKGGCTAAARFNGKKEGEIDDKECASNQAIYREIIKLILEKPENAEILTKGKVSIR